MTTDPRHTFAPILAGAVQRDEDSGIERVRYLPPTTGKMPVFVPSGSRNRPAYRFAMTVPAGTLAGHLAGTPDATLATVTFNADLAQN